MNAINERVRLIRESKGLNQTDFGKQIGLSRDAIANIEGDRVNVKDLTISMICREFNVSESWLRDGEGEPFLTMDRDDEIMAAVGKILADEPESFRRRWISVMCRLSPNEWEVLEKICKEMFGNNSGNEKD